MAITPAALRDSVPSPEKPVRHFPSASGLAYYCPNTFQKQDFATRHRLVLALKPEERSGLRSRVTREGSKRYIPIFAPVLIRCSEEKTADGKTIVLAPASM